MDDMWLNDTWISHTESVELKNVCPLVIEDVLILLSSRYAY